MITFTDPTGRPVQIVQTYTPTLPDVAPERSGERESRAAQWVGLLSLLAFGALFGWCAAHLIGGA